MENLDSLHPHSAFRALNGTYPAQCDFRPGVQERASVRAKIVKRRLNESTTADGRISYGKKHNSFTFNYNEDPKKELSRQ